MQPSFFPGRTGPACTRGGRRGAPRRALGTGQTRASRGSLRLELKARHWPTIEDARIGDIERIGVSTAWGRTILVGVYRLLLRVSAYALPHFHTFSLCGLFPGFSHIGLEDWGLLRAPTIRAPFLETHRSRFWTTQHQAAVLLPEACGVLPETVERTSASHVRRRISVSPTICSRRRSAFSVTKSEVWIDSRICMSLQKVQQLADILRTRRNKVNTTRRSVCDQKCDLWSELWAARSRLYRSRFLQVNTRWKALAEIYTMHSFAPFSNLKIFVKICWFCFAAFFRKFRKFCQDFAEFSPKFFRDFSKNAACF